MPKKEKTQTLFECLRQDEVFGYVVNAYYGVEPAPSNPAVMRRVFLWEEEDEVKMGNAEAFTLHLGRRFQRKTSAGDASALHRLLRDLGEAITPHQKHNKPKPDSPKKGKFRQPEPDEWVVRKK